MCSGQEGGRGCQNCRNWPCRSAPQTAPSPPMKWMGTCIFLITLPRPVCLSGCKYLTPGFWKCVCLHNGPYMQPGAPIQLNTYYLPWLKVILVLWTHWKEHAKSPVWPLLMGFLSINLNTQVLLLWEADTEMETNRIFIREWDLHLGEGKEGCRLGRGSPNKAVAVPMGNSGSGLVFRVFPTWGKEAGSLPHC